MDLAAENNRIARASAGEVCAREQRIVASVRRGQARSTWLFHCSTCPRRCQPGARHRTFDSPEGAGQRRVRPPRLRPVTPAAQPSRPTYLASSATGTLQHHVVLRADQFPHEPPSPIAQLSLNRIKPIVEEPGSRLGFTLRGIGLRDGAGQGIVPVRALTLDDSRSIASETTPPSIPTTTATAPRRHKRHSHRLRPKSPSSPG